MWSDYCDLNPAARRIYDLLTGQGEVVLNDHIALRTLNHPRLGIDNLGHCFEKFGYKKMDKEYFFKNKKLYARHWQHENDSLPKIFISELELENVSAYARETLNKLVEQIPDSFLKSDQYPFGGRPWKVDYATFLKLAEESEYASWFAAWGFRPNHFTVNINALKNYQDILKLNSFIESNGFVLNSSGGVVKGTPEQYLEQSSTMANEITCQFSDQSANIPGCYYEFAKRYKMNDGKFYQGFVAASADKIFESTNRIKS